MKSLSLFILLLVLLNNTSFSQNKPIIVNRLIDFEIGMSYEKIIEKYPNPTLEDKKGKKIDIYYKSLELSNGVTLTELLLSLYDNKLYYICTDYSNTLHLGLSTKYGYKLFENGSFKGFYGTSNKGNIKAFHTIDNKIIINDNRFNDESSTEGF